MLDLSARIGNLTIDPAWMDCSGIFPSLDILESLGDRFGAYVTKSVGKEPRKGFMEPIIYNNDSFTLNSVGLTNQGAKAMREDLEKRYPMRKPVVCDVFGETPDEYVEVADILGDRCDAVSLNLGCPNNEPGKNLGMIFGRDPKLVKYITESVKDVVKVPVIAKLTPNVLDTKKTNIESIARAAEEGGADAIAAINTVFPGMKINIYARRPVLTNKFGGISGPAIKPQGVACVYKIYEAVKIPVIAMGGIRLSTAEDLVEYAEAGGSAFGIGTDLANKKTTAVKRSLTRFRNKVERLVEELGASSIKELVGVAHGL